MPSREIKNLAVRELRYTRANEIREKLGGDKALPDRATFERMAADPELIPAEFRVFKLIFPNVIKTATAEGPSQAVTDIMLGALIWSGKRWEPRWYHAGKEDWSSSNPEEMEPGARLLRYKT